MTNINTNRPVGTPTAAQSTGAQSPETISTPGEFERIKEDLLGGIAPGSGNSHWLSFREAEKLIKRARAEGPDVESQLKAVFAQGLNDGAIEGRDLAVGGRCLKLLSEFSGVDVNVYLDAVPEIAKTTGADKLRAATFDRTARTDVAAASGGVAGPQAQMARTVGEQLSTAATALTRPATPEGPLDSVEKARAFADSTLQDYLDDFFGKSDDGVSAKSAKDFNIDLDLPRGIWEDKDFENQSALKRMIHQASGFIAKLAQDVGTMVNLNVSLIPKGDFDKVHGKDHDTLYVPVNEGKSSLELRDDWDGGKFIQTENWWNPLDHMKTAKLRALWKLAGNPTSVLRTRMRRLMGDASEDLSKAVNNVQAKFESGELSLDKLRDSASSMIRSFTGADTKTASGDNFRDALAGKFADMEGSEIVSFLGKWKEMALDASQVEEISRFAVGASANRLRDNRNTFGLVNVDTYDTVSVAPDSILGRHGQPAINDVEYNGIRVGLVNVSSTDMVSVVPDLARMIFGGSTAEKAASAEGII